MASLRFPKRHPIVLKWLIYCLEWSFGDLKNALAEYLWIFLKNCSNEIHVRRGLLAVEGVGTIGARDCKIHFATSADLFQQVMDQLIFGN